MISRFKLNPELRRLIAFGAVGFTAFCVYLLLVAACVEAGASQVAGAVAGFAGGTIISFFGNCRFVFKTSPSAAAGGRFFITTLAGFALNVALAWLLTSWGVHYAVMTLVIFLVVPGFNYLGHRFWTFAQSQPPAAN
jgi:putative flippase GtrA